MSPILRSKYGEYLTEEQAKKIWRREAIEDGFKGALGLLLMGLIIAAVFLGAPILFPPPH